MNPCAKNREQIAWLTLGALDAQQARTLREHIQLCDGCRRYFEEITKVNARLNAAAIKLDIVPSASFHRNLAARLGTVEPNSVRGTTLRLPGWMAVPWRVALPAFAATVALILGISLGLRHPPAPRADPRGAHAGLAAGKADRWQPTIASYQVVAARSLDEFDELLTREGTKRLPTAPTFTASLFRTEGGSN